MLTLKFVGQENSLQRVNFFKVNQILPTMYFIQAESVVLAGAIRHIDTSKWAGAATVPLDVQKYSFL